MPCSSLILGWPGLAVIALSCPALFKERDGADGPLDDLGLTGRIIGFLANELVSFITGNHNAILSLVACIKNGLITPGITDSLTLIGKKQISIVKSKR